VGVGVGGQGAGEVSDDLVVGAAIAVGDASLDVGAWNAWVEDALVQAGTERGGAVADPGMDEASSEQELPAQLEPKGAQARGEVRWLHDHGAVAAVGVDRRGDAVGDPERTRRGGAGEPPVLPHGVAAL